MKKTLLCCIIASTFTTLVHGAEKVIIYGDDDYAPYSYVENGQFKGIYVDVLKNAIQKLPAGYQVELRPIPWKRGLDLLESGAGFALFPPYMKKERTYIQSYSVPLLREEVALFCHEDAMKSVRKKFPEDFSGITIGINAGFALTDTLGAAAKSGKVNLSEAKGNESNLKKLASKRVDCYANDKGSILYSAKKLRADPQFGNFKLIEAAMLSGESAHIGYSVNFKAAYKTDFIEKMNAALNEVKKGDAINTAVEAYIK
ncbi:substrate-binding periplasmic protein [Noviherbaspirillum saxi]|nr:transporter substrate-binding domain-containing protein [Noviherbaspirillum saxi]